MKLMTMKQYMKMSKPALIRKITKTLRAMPKKRLAVLCYNITKSKLPRIPYGTSVKIRAAPLELSRRQVLKKGRWTTRRKTKPLDTKTLEFYEKQQTYKTTFKKKRKKKRKFSRKQLAAQRLFAKRARAGTLRKRRRR